MMYLIAGEASGDLHGSNLMKAMLDITPNLELRFCGGDLMKSVGGTLVQHYKNRAFMGFTEVIKNLSTIKKALKELQEDILDCRPEKLILIDNPGFNMRMAKFAKKHGIPVHYYIAPKVWAWNTKRVKKLEKTVDKLYSILPFESAFFKQHGLDVEYVGNPVMDALKQNTPSIPKEIPKNKRIIALLPGSRKPEVEKMLPPMLEVAALHPDWIFVIAVAPNFELGYFKKFQTSNVIALKDNTYDILSASNAAIVTSGTATLETALLRVPQMVCYKLSPLTYWIGKQVVKVKYISLVNLILDKPAVKELVQEDCNALAINTELQRIMSTEGLVQIQSDYVELNKTIGNIKTSEVVAQRILA